MGPMKLPQGEGVWLSQLRVSNFRSIASLELEFRHRLTLLIGANGAGKTSVLDAIAMILQSRPERRDVEESDRRRVGREAAEEASIELSGIGPRAAVVRAREGGRSSGFPGEWDTWKPSLAAFYGAERKHGRAFDELVHWFASKDVEEARRIREIGDVNYRDPELENVRSVVSNMIRGTSNLRIDARSNRLVTDQIVEGRTETFEVGQLAGGLRTMLVLVADLARMMIAAAAQLGGNPRPVVLIDEIDLHLHPAWQLDVMRNLLDAFPEVQFIVTTHSEEIIASVPSECVVSLHATDSGIVARSIPPVQGATFDRVLESAMEVPSRRDPKVQAILDQYFALIDAGQGESREATKLRAMLDDLFKGSEPELIKADVAIRLNRARRAAGS